MKNEHVEVITALPAGKQGKPEKLEEKQKEKEDATKRWLQLC